MKLLMEALDCSSKEQANLLLANISEAIETGGQIPALGAGAALIDIVRAQIEEEGDSDDEHREVDVNDRIRDMKITAQEMRG